MRPVRRVDLDPVRSGQAHGPRGGPAPGPALRRGRPYSAQNCPREALGACQHAGAVQARSRPRNAAGSADHSPHCLSASRTASWVHPAKQWTRTLPSGLSLSERLGLLSSWAGQWATHPSPNFRPTSAAAMLSASEDEKTVVTSEAAIEMARLRQNTSGNLEAVFILNN